MDVKKRTDNHDTIMAISMTNTLNNIAFADFKETININILIELLEQ